eukprot:7038595-Karenia_brevis.AAC.1
MHGAAYFQRFREPVATALPRARQALKGWEKASPVQTRDPIPWEVCCSICQYFLKHCESKGLEASV